MRRRDLVAGGAAAVTGGLLGGCNLRPLHGGERGAAMQAELAAIEVTTPLDQLGQQLKTQLADELNPRGLDEPARYELLVTLRRTRNALAIQLRDQITRYDMIIAAFYQLRRKADGRVLFRSAGRRVASFNVRRAPFATQIAQQDAERRAAEELSRDIGLQLALFFEGQAA